MESLRAYLKSLPLQQQIEFAKRCGTTVGYLRKVLSVGGPLREKLCAVIESQSRGAVTRRDLRPDDWQDIWPELAESEPKQAPALACQALVAINPEAKEAAHA